MEKRKWPKHIFFVPEAQNFLNPLVLMGNNLLYLEEACTHVYEYVKKTVEYL